MAPPPSPPTPLHAFLTARTGMALSGPQRRRLDERVAARLGALTEAQYLAHLQSPAGAAELAELIAAVVVHKTDLFRDEVQLAAFQTHVLAPLVTRAARPLRVWSAGCATGEEVATLLVLLAEAKAHPGSTVLGTDISETALARARQQRFGAEQMRRVPAPLRERWFEPLGAGATLALALRERAGFQYHNLMDAPYPVSEDGAGFDVIFCRNVLIYFTPEAFERAVARLSERLAPGGTLVLSAAEPLLQVPPHLRAQRCESAFFYVRVGEDEGASSAPEWRRRDAGSFPSVSSLLAPGSGGEGTATQVSGRTRDSGRYSTVGSSEPARVSGSFATVEPGPARSRDSGSFATVSPAIEPASMRKRESGAFSTVAPEPAASARNRDSGGFPTVASGEPARDSGSFPAVEPASARRRDSGGFSTVSPEPPRTRDSGRFPALGLPSATRPDSGRFSSVPTAPTSSGARDSGRFTPVAPASTAPREPSPPAASSEYAEADALFIRALEGTGAGEGGDARTEEYLRRCLALDGDLAAARFLLGMLLELRDARAEAALEYRRALRSLEEGRARQVPFFLNPARLQVACLRAIERMGDTSPPR